MDNAKKIKLKERYERWRDYVGDGDRETAAFFTICASRAQEDQLHTKTGLCGPGHMEFNWPKRPDDDIKRAGL